MTMMQASQEFEHFTQMTPFQRSSAINNLKAYCQDNANDNVMNRLLDIVSAESYDGLTALEEK